MNLQGFFQLNKEKYYFGESIWLTLIIKNENEKDVYLFIPRGRDNGIQIIVKKGKDLYLENMTKEPEAGLVAQEKLPAGATYQQKYLLSQWLKITQPGDYKIECSIKTEAYNKSLDQDNLERMAMQMIFVTDLYFIILPVETKGTEKSSG